MWPAANPLAARRRATNGLTSGHSLVFNTGIEEAVNKTQQKTKAVRQIADPSFCHVIAFSQQTFTEIPLVILLGINFPEKRATVYGHISGGVFCF